MHLQIWRNQGEEPEVLAGAALRGKFPPQRLKFSGVKLISVREPIIGTKYLKMHLKTRRSLDQLFKRTRPRELLCISDCVMLLFWIWRVYMELLGGLCIVGLTQFYDDGKFPVGCWPFDQEPWSSRVLVRNLLWDQKYRDFGTLLWSDQELSTRLQYTWENVTVFVPDPNSSEWKNLRLADEFYNGSCVAQPDECTKVRKFLRRHIMEGSLPKKGRKISTMGGTTISWDQVGQYQYLYPGAVKVLNRTEAYNGEVLEIEKPLWSDPKSIRTGK